uniref:(northern house mosquito) hypothetical protein n=1 Tax=Culex pipiens TaxID=7175 RepID=A0A8D8AEJ1_CULPI
MVARPASGTCRTIRRTRTSWFCGIASRRAGRRCPATRTSRRWTGTAMERCWPPGRTTDTHGSGAPTACWRAPSASTRDRSLRSSGTNGATTFCRRVWTRRPSSGMRPPASARSSLASTRPRRWTWTGSRTSRLPAAARISAFTCASWAWTSRSSRSRDTRTKSTPSSGIRRGSCWPPVQTT